uniref:Phosphatidylinositol transfer protein N-terminal domain-containing protein n=1 Tax=Pygocentrus nattereri TaxID=42514 RepID=A0AAR2KA28_PYGNA
MLLKEYRICMPLTVEEYKIGQLYMISKHSLEQSSGGEGVEVVRNEPDTHPQYGQGQVTEKRIYLSSKLPSWMRKFVPMIFYVTEKAWNFYPYTVTGELHHCSFVPKLQVKIETRFENDNGSNENVSRQVICDCLTLQDLSGWVSKRTGRGPLVDGWRNSARPIMCSYKKVQCSFEVYGFQSRTEEFIHRNIRDVLLVGHRQAVAWTDEWHGMSLEEVREYERKLQQETNSKLKSDRTDSGNVSDVLTQEHRDPGQGVVEEGGGGEDD